MTCRLRNIDVGEHTRGLDIVYGKSKIKIRLTMRNGDDVVSLSTITSLFSKTIWGGNDSEAQLEASTTRRNQNKVQKVLVEEDDERLELRCAAAFLRFR